MRISIVYIFLCATISFSCKDAGVSDPYPSGRYVPGDVVVGFVDTVNYSFIRSFISNMNLTQKPILADTSFYFWIQVDSGHVDQQIKNLEKYTALRWAVEKHYDGGDPYTSYIYAGFRDTLKIEDAMTFIRSIRGLSWKQTIRWSIFVLISVKPGQEIQWINRFKTYPFIRSAELNGYGYID